MEKRRRVTCTHSYSAHGLTYACRWIHPAQFTRVMNIALTKCHWLVVYPDLHSAATVKVKKAVTLMIMVIRAVSCVNNNYITCSCCVFYSFVTSVQVTKGFVRPHSRDVCSANFVLHLIGNFCIYVHECCFPENQVEIILL